MEPLPAERVELASWPTPLEAAPRLAEAIGLRPGDLWIKRDDLTGLGAGGNKIRKLEWNPIRKMKFNESLLMKLYEPAT